MTVVRGAAVAAFVMFALSSFAALSPKYREWGNGPVHGIMTADEQLAWTQLAADADAEQFIELFWARRDPTPGTPLNEYKANFDDRVHYADANFADVDDTGTVIRRGAMTDRGQALIVLGYWQARRAPGVDTVQNHAQVRTTAKTTGEVDIWYWIKDEALRRFGMDRVEVGFVQDPKGIYHRDLARHDYAAAEAFAIDKAIVNRDLASVPDWAKPQAPGAEPGVAIARIGKPGARHLMLVKDARAIVNNDVADPFANVETTSIFGRQDDLAYVLEYCGPVDPVTIRSAIRGTVEGKPVNVGPPAMSAHLDPIKTVPGCSMLRAAIPLAGFPMLTPGTFTFIVQVDDGAGRYNLSQDFKIE